MILSLRDVDALSKLETEQTEEINFGNLFSSKRSNNGET